MAVRIVRVDFAVLRAPGHWGNLQLASDAGKKVVLGLGWVEVAIMECVDQCLEAVACDFNFGCW